MECTIQCQVYSVRPRAAEKGGVTLQPVSSRNYPFPSLVVNAVLWDALSSKGIKPGSKITAIIKFNPIGTGGYVSLEDVISVN